YGFVSWPRLVHHLQAARLHGIKRALVLADAAELSSLLAEDATAATTPVGDLPPLLVLLRRSTSTPSDVRECARLLLAPGAPPARPPREWAGQGRRAVLFDAAERGALPLAQLLVDRGATPDEDAFYHACEQANTGFLDLLHRPGYERMVLHKLDFED